MANVRSAGRRRRTGWLICSVVYVAGTYGLGWFISHQFSFVPWALGTTCILAGTFAGRWVCPRLERRVASMTTSDAPR